MWRSQGLFPKSPAEKWDGPCDEGEVPLFQGRFAGHLRLAQPQAIVVFNQTKLVHLGGTALGWL